MIIIKRLLLLQIILAYKEFFHESFQLVWLKVKLHFHVKTNIKFFINLHFHVEINIRFFTALMPLEYGKLFWICFICYLSAHVL